nr:type 1 glutamine amidotransferase domain-containing protein [uncultured Sphingomonas sp.]
MTRISDAHILIMASDRFEESELFEPLDLLTAAGASVTIAAPEMGMILGTVRDVPGRSIAVDIAIDDVRAEKFDALLLPGGVSNPDHLRTNDRAISIIRDFARRGKPVAAICHGPWLLVEADLLRGRRATCWPSIRTDLRNAGAILEDEAAVADGNIITSRMPDDVPAFTAALISAVEACA